MVQDGEAGGGCFTLPRLVRLRERLICLWMLRMPCCPCRPEAWWSVPVCGGSWSCGGSGAGGAPGSGRPHPGSPCHLLLLPAPAGDEGDPYNRQIFKLLKQHTNCSKVRCYCHLWLPTRIRIHLSFTSSPILKPDNLQFCQDFNQILQGN